MVAGAIAFGATVLCARLAPTTRNWSGLWATALIVSAAIPLLGAIFTALSAWFPILEPTSTLLLPIGGPIDLSVFAGPGEGPAATPSDVATPPTLIVFAIIAGAVVCLARLYSGRRKAIGVSLRAHGPRQLRGHSYWISHEVDTAFAIVGVVPRRAPRIILPARIIEELPERELVLILRHEQAHIRRRDDQIGVMLRALTALTWFIHSCS
nr:M56 family metallopeptidase [Erythrobacter ani]